MANIELVIKISEEEYKNICIMSKDGIGMALYDWIANGTPLPKGHGRLKDADELYSIFKELCDDYSIDNLSFISDMDMNFDLAQTIIEADKGSEE